MRDDSICWRGEGMALLYNALSCIVMWWWIYNGIGAGDLLRHDMDKFLLTLVIVTSYGATSVYFGQKSGEKK